MVTRDPLAGTDEDATRRDGRRWEALLAAVAADGEEWDPWGLYGLLRGLRALGATLEASRIGWRLDPPPGMSRDEMRDEIGDHAQRLGALLRHAPRLDLPIPAEALPDALEVQRAYELA